MAAPRGILQDWARQYRAASPGGASQTAVAPQQPNQVIASFGGRPMGWLGGANLAAGGSVVTGRGGAAGLGNALYGAYRPGQVIRGAGAGTPGAQAPGAAGGAAASPYPGVGLPRAQAPGSPAVPLGIPAGGSGTGGGIPSVADLIAQVTAKEDEANRANEGRYQQLLDNADKDKRETTGAIAKGYGDLLGRAGTDAAGVRAKQDAGWAEVLKLAGADGTKAAREREERTKKSELGQAGQSLANRGLVGTTITDSVRGRITDDSALRMQGIDDAQLGRQLSAQQNMLAQTIPTELRLNEGQQAIGLQQVGANVGAIANANAGRQGVIERRTDEGPDLGMYTQLLGTAGALQAQQAQLAAQAAQVQGGSTAANGYAQLIQQILGQYQGTGGIDVPRSMRPVGQQGGSPQNASGSGFVRPGYPSYSNFFGRSGNGSSLQPRPGTPLQPWEGGQSDGGVLAGGGFTEVPRGQGSGYGGQGTGLQSAFPGQASRPGQPNDGESAPDAYEQFALDLDRFYPDLSDEARQRALAEWRRQNG